MSEQIKTIGVFTSGGDAPGMNAAIRSVVRKAKFDGLTVKGIMRGYEGLINNEMIEMDSRSVGGILSCGGTILKTARSKEFMTKEGREKAAKNIKENNIDGLIIIGGNGSFMGASIFEKEWGIKTVGVPGTIDNDLGGTDYTIGAHTSVDTVLDAVDKIRDTVSSMERIYVIEVMGRKEPYIAVMAGLSGGAEEILYPGCKFDIKKLVEEIKQGEKKGKKSWIIIVSEGFSSGPEIAEKISKESGHEVRSVVLGHVQRGGSPNAPDRILASMMGAYAVEALSSGKSGCMVAINGKNLSTVPYEEACFERDKDFEFNEKLYLLTKMLAS